MNRLIIIGASSYGKVVADIAMYQMERIYAGLYMLESVRGLVLG